MKKLLITALLLLPLNEMATTEIEREKLQQIASEMEVISQMVVEAKQFSSESDPKIFEYQALLWNLREMKVAIERHINEQSTAPRSVEDLMTLSN